MRPILFALSTSLALTACALPPQVPERSAYPPSETHIPLLRPVSNTAMLTLDDAAQELVQVSLLSADLQRSERARLDTDKPTGARLQFRLGLLLVREDDSALLERGMRILSGIRPADGQAQAVLELVLAQAKSQSDLRRQTARLQELQTRIDQIKALEKSLQQREDPPKPR